MYIYFRPALTFAFISSIQGDSYLADNIIYRHSCKRIIKGQVFFFFFFFFFFCKSAVYVQSNILYIYHGYNNLAFYPVITGWGHTS